jgi:hypothetical protein
VYASTPRYRYIILRVNNVAAARVYYEGRMGRQLVNCWQQTAIVHGALLMFSRFRQDGALGMASIWRIRSGETRRVASRTGGVF